MAIIRWDPFNEFWAGRDSVLTRNRWAPPVDIYETDDAVVIKAELPDMKREDIDVVVENGTLTLSGERKLDEQIDEDSFHRIERRYGAFSRSFTLPDRVDADRVSAEYHNGVLIIRLPLRPESRPRQIQVEAA